tara:strand:+ start:661 stop:1188 length:528 start_codon:yes stop_codon:yes gene_type:complete
MKTTTKTRTVTDEMAKLSVLELHEAVVQYVQREKPDCPDEAAVHIEEDGRTGAIVLWQTQKSDGAEAAEPLLEKADATGGSSKRPKDVPKEPPAKPTEPPAETAGVVTLNVIVGGTPVEEIQFAPTVGAAWKDEVHAALQAEGLTGKWKWMDKPGTQRKVPKQVEPGLVLGVELP